MSKRKTVTILNTYVAALKTATGYSKTSKKPVAMNVPLKYMLYDIPDACTDWLIKVRNMEYHSKEQAKAKDNTPRYYISGIYDMTEFEYGRFPVHDYPKVQSDLMVVECDEQDNEGIDIWKHRKDIFELPYVFSCIKSISGHGFYCIIPIEDTHYTKEYYKYISKLWKQKYGINLDEKASSLVRARIISYDEDRDSWIKKDSDIEVWNLKLVEEKKAEKKKELEINYSKYEKRNKDSESLDWEFITNKAMELLIRDGYNVKGYYAWYHLGTELANFDNGEELFRIASNNGSYDDTEKDIAKRWKSISPSGIDDNLIRKWCGMAKNKYGVEWMKKLNK